MNEETKAIVEAFEKRLGDLRSVFSPIIPNSLANLDGWTWRVEETTERRLINQGQVIDIFPTIQRGVTNERGWINQLSAFFSDPETQMIATSDNWTVIVSPVQLNVLGLTQANPTTVFNAVFNPASLIGPLFGIQWTAGQFWPYKTKIVFQARHPRTALTLTSQLIFAVLGRHYISDEKLFYESIFIESQRQTIGKVQIPIRRPV